MDGLILRDAAAGDEARIAELSAQLGYPCQPEEVRARVLERAHEPPYRLIVAQSDRVIGWTSVGIVDHFYLPPYAEISGLVVDECERNKGVGAMLIREAERWARSLGARTLRLRANVIREEAHRFYRREGFTEKKRQILFELDLRRDRA